MTPDQAIDDARDAVAAEKQSRAAWEDALADRDDKVRAAFTANPDIGPTELAARVGLTASTVRQITAHLARERRRQRD